MIQAVRSDEKELLELKSIISAQLELAGGTPGSNVQSLPQLVKSVSISNRPLAWYWLGQHQLASSSLDEQQAGMLLLLRIPALHGREQPDLAGAALFHVMQGLSQQKDDRGSVAIRRELLDRYGQTTFAKTLKGTAPVTKDTP